MDKPGTNQLSGAPPGAALGGPEEQHRLLMECVTDYAIFFLDPRGFVATWNAGAERILGYRESEAVGEPLSHFFTPEDNLSGQPEKELQTAARTGRANDDRWLVRKDGTRLWCSGVTTALRDEEGTLRGFAKVVRDVSDRRRAIESLHQQFVSLVENSSEFIGLATVDGSAYFVNEAGRRLVGLDGPDEVRRTQVIDYFPPEDRTRIRDEVLPAVLRDGRWSGEVRFRHFKTGATIPVAWNVVSLKEGATGQPVALAWISSDLIDRKSLEEALRQRAEELAEDARHKDEFLAVLAHELRNPLAPVRNALRVIRSGSNDPALVEQMGAMAERQVGYMAHLVDDLLDLSRISRGLLRLLREPLDLALPVQHAVEGVQPLVRERGLTLSVSLPPGPLHAEADATRVQQVVSNLLNNAAKYTDPGGHVLLDVGREGDEWVLRVRDTGIGIAADMLPTIFDLFVQAERRLNRSQGGLGIGLTLVRRLVEMHGGSVTAHSDGPGRGSEFVVRLPALAEARQAELRQPPPDREQAAVVSPRRSILVVDDNVDAAESLALLLRLEGHNVRTAHDGSAGLQAAQAERPQLVILDLGMPVMDGFEVARRLRALAGWEDVLLVALTGWAQEEDRRRCYEAGFDGHLPKPVELDTLRQFFGHPKLHGKRAAER